ncbi:Nitrous oxidase accessory protein NosD, contains tandem CASH domains [Halogranum rubrum]|uniref:Nitrous oxidase accessory protein NosD, contains tandem CASH domains n=1 Tax=Halogranum rubrum TaxID=553466 RepID=A0A1I4BCP0_9EURY|nr:NosD domain-containing protein [Halogranum rubrum]SFK66303.1 Nitrous oxidase accessory protein NosD, contains tandem CASH domains [Halogranum rubrum]
MALLTPTGTRWLSGILTVVLLVSMFSFVLTPVGGKELRPVPFEDTVDAGGTSVDIQRSLQEGFIIPQAEVFYSNYRYVVGYYGVRMAAAELADPGTERQFGTPLAVYVSDFSTVTPTLTDEGFIIPESGRAVGWVAADRAMYVIDSEAHIPSGPAVMPFSDRTDAEQFAETYGGDVVGWKTLQSRVDTPLEHRLARFDEMTASYQTWANQTVASSRGLLERPRSFTVGEDAPNVSAAIAAAPPNTTVYVPPGQYETTELVVTKPLTIVGAGNETVIRGDGTGSVVHVRADNVAIHNLRVAGVGDIGSRSPERANQSVNWDTNIQLAYGYGDAAVVLDGSNNSVVSNVHIKTASSGIIVRESNRSVIDNVTVDGAPTPNEGFMGAILIDGRSIVQDSTFRDGRDGIYTHRADGSVIRYNRMEGGRYGVHEMYTSRTLVTRNDARDTQTGIIVMGRPTENIVIHNAVRDSVIGIVSAGGNSLYANNTIVHNRDGLRVTGDQNIFMDNVIVSNDVGIKTNEILPANWVLRNDVVGNAKSVDSQLGPLRTWTYRGIGNYWGPLPLPDRDDDGVYDRAYEPTGTVDSRLGTTSGGTTLAQSPAAATLRRVRDVVSGLRQSGVIDTAPRTVPFHPQRLADLNMNATAGTTT